MLSQLEVSRILRWCGVIALCLLACGAPAQRLAAQAPQPVVLLGDGDVVPSSFDGDLFNLPYVPPTPESNVELNIQPSLFKIAQGLKRGGVTRAQGPEIPLGAMPAPSLTFDAMTYALNGAGHPPDTNGDVGLAYYMESVNTSIGIYSKATGNAAAPPFTFNSFWAGAGTGTPCDASNQGDPIVLYDALGGRFLFMDFAWTNTKDGPYYFCFAVSKTSNPVSGGYWRYAIRADDAAHPYLPDYPKGGVWPDGFYFSSNMFDCLNTSCSSATYQEARAYAFNRIKMEAGSVLTANDVQIADTDANQFTLMPSNMRLNLPPAGRPNLFVGEDTINYFWNVWKFHVDYVTPANSTFTGPTQVTQGAYGFAAASVPEPSGGNNSDTLRDRMMFLNQYTNLGGTESLWVQHTIGQPTNVGASTPTGIQWAQLKVTGGNVTLTPVQEQLFYNGNDGLNRFMGSMAVDGSGNVALGYTASSSSVAPDIRYVGRLKTDPLNQLPRTEVTMLPSVTRNVQTGTCGPATCTRWGDYSSMSMDPVDGCTFWYANMYFPVTGGNWVTRIGRFRFANPTCVDRKYVYLPAVEK